MLVLLYCSLTTWGHCPVTEATMPALMGANIQSGSGGTEPVIGLRSAMLSPDWSERCERRESPAPAAVYLLQSPLTAGAAYTH
ncbi:hypothetical protein KUCAC02_022778 [Chaenocephalus aceratus]|uniref:Uncharacterized protein n=1 Tax=Chaenocephalus aceratus TaxID=36190 RepID=A0ACB9XP60_CHAAC|nr:hypothetical protein KUCAC02_022778 [Chaenocephalus aceratus]